MPFVGLAPSILNAVSNSTTSLDASSTTCGGNEPCKVFLELVFPIIGAQGFCCLYSYELSTLEIGLGANDQEMNRHNTVNSSTILAIMGSYGGRADKDIEIQPVTICYQFG